MKIKLMLTPLALWGMVGSTVIALAVYGWYAVDDLLRQNPAGYCAAQKRYIADDEFIRTAVALYEWEWNIGYKVGPDGKIIKKKDEYKDRYQKWERYRNQPECCHVYRGDTQSAFNRMFGWQEVEITLFTDQENRGDRQLPFAFDVCGKLLPHEWGYHLSSDFPLTTSNYQEFIIANTK